LCFSEPAPAGDAPSQPAAVAAAKPNDETVGEAKADAVATPTTVDAVAVDSSGDKN